MLLAYLALCGLALRRYSARSRKPDAGSDQLELAQALVAAYGAGVGILVSSKPTFPMRYFVCDGHHPHHRPSGMTQPEIFSATRAAPRDQAGREAARS
jgi:hypothetical protein